ncbi:SMI1/KNR4 family protein [Actinomadura adrarensis]|uniref:SMI1/KNR4 family protein n=1 Tax=Actinomadura adrarensis TaxID=1819600 RepID=A0ABW3CN70_9ACTN
MLTPDAIFEAVAAATGPDLPPVATPEAVTEAELAIGYPLPPLLRRLYLELGNGGFGPRNAITGILDLDRDFHHGDIFESLNHSAVEYRHDPDKRMAGMVALLEWGCAISTLLDCRDPGGQMWGWDPDTCCREHSLFPMDITFNEWLADSIGQKYDDVFHDGYFEGDTSDTEGDAGDESGLIRLGVDDVDEDENQNAPCPYDPPVWVKGRRLR